MYGKERWSIADASYTRQDYWRRIRDFYSADRQARQAMHAAKFPHATLLQSSLCMLRSATMPAGLTVFFLDLMCTRQRPNLTL